MMHVNGFLPYFYVAAPFGFLTPDCTALKDCINVSPLRDVVPVVI